MSVVTAIYLILLGAAFGGFGGLFGVGGGIIAIPTLIVLFKLDQQTAQGTTLVMILPSALLGFWKYRQRNSINLRMAAMLCASAVLATYIAARLANAMSNESLRLAFAVFLIVIALYLAWRILRTNVAKASRGELAWCHSWIVGAVGGFLSGLFGIGGATIAPPALTTFFGLTQTAAQGLALAMITPGIVVALGVYAQAGAIDWTMGVALAIGAVVAVPLGVALAHSLSGEKLKLLFCGLLMLSAAAIIAGH
jgi:uncharacterized membrane protein YfcA